MLRGGLVATAQWLLQRWPIDRVISTGQAEVDEEVPRRTPGPRVPLGLSVEVLTSIDLDGVERFRIHIRRVKHNVLRRAVPDGIISGW